MVKVKRIILISGIVFLLAFAIKHLIDQNNIMWSFPRDIVQKSSNFLDVKENSEYYQSIKESVELGYMNGYPNGKFGPEEKLTRGQFAQVLYNGYSNDFIGTNTQFRDVFREAWYTDAVAWTNHYGLMDGYSAESFQPELPLMWEQVIQMLYRFAGEPHSYHKLGYLRDYEKIDKDIRNAYSWALENEIIMAPGDRVHPKNEITRGELAELLPKYNEYIVETGKQRPVQSIPDISDMIMEELFFKHTELEPYNNELQDYVPEQAEFTENGVVITAEDLGNGIYQSGNIQSNVSVRYGVFEFTFNNLAGKGYWPAIWMLPDSEKTRFPELDIYEMVGKKPEQLLGTLHHFDQKASKNLERFEYSSDTVEFNYEPDDIPEQTTIRLDWNEDELVWTYNGQMIRKITKNVPDNYMYLIINLAIGGSWPGDPAPETEFPAKFQVEITRFEPEQVKYRGD